MKDLIFELYKYTGYLENGYKEVQRPYLEYFKNCKNVLDLGSGKGTFLELLAEADIKGTGIEDNPHFYEYAEKKGLNLIKADVFEYLKDCKEESCDGIFSSHFIEHLPYEKTLQLFQLSYKVLSKEGKILVVTPNVRSIKMHLDAFYRDFSHVIFYHPDIVEFFLSHVGFSIFNKGEAPQWDSPLFSDFKSRILSLNNRYEMLGQHRTLTLKNKNICTIFKLLQEKLEKIIAKYLLHGHCQLIGEITNNLLDIINKLDRPSECYVYAVKK